MVQSVCDHGVPESVLGTVAKIAGASCADCYPRGKPLMYHCDPRDYPPDVRDGLTHRERIVLQCLHALQQERGGRNVPTGMLYGSVVEHVDMSVEEMQSILVRLVGHE